MVTKPDKAQQAAEKASTNASAKTPTKPNANERREERERTRTDKTATEKLVTGLLLVFGIALIVLPFIHYTPLKAAGQVEHSR
jgi:hypothetical protein